MATTLQVPETDSGKLLKRTRSRCPVCHRDCPAEVKLVPGTPAKVFLERSCAEHGAVSICIASDARFFWLSLGSRPDSAGCCAPPQPFGSIPGPDSHPACCAADGSSRGTLGRNANGRDTGPFEKLSTCLALIEIVNSCNLTCPVCYADSLTGTGAKTDAVPLQSLQKRIQGVIDRKGPIEILQLSGGEPTLHPQFFELIDWVQSHPKIDYLLINTNGVRIATDRSFANALRTAANRRHIQLYLQYDGPQPDGQISLRGADLREFRRRAIEACGEVHLPLTLAMTVTPENLSSLWAAIEFGLSYSHVRGICFQPMFQSGRLAAEALRHSPRLNTADIILNAVEQAAGKLRFEDFTPLPCGDPNCATIGYLLKIDGEIRSISDFIDFSQIQGFLKDKVRYQLEDLIRCGCESEPLGELLKQFELDESNTFRLLIKPFMDASTWDEDRIDRCCTHVIRPDGKLDSFCRYYSGFADVKAAP